MRRGKQMQWCVALEEHFVSLLLRGRRHNTKEKPEAASCSRESLLKPTCCHHRPLTWYFFSRACDTPDLATAYLPKMAPWSSAVFNLHMYSLHGFSGALRDEVLVK